MSTVATMEPKKPSRRMSVSGFFTAPWTKKERKVAVVIEPKNVIIEEATILSYTPRQTSSPKVERAYVVKDSVLAVGKFPVPKEELARNAVNREIRCRQPSKVTRKKTDSSHKGGLFESFRSNKRHKVKAKDSKSPVTSVKSYPSVKPPSADSVPALTALARARNLAMYADETPQFDRVYSRSVSNFARSPYEHYSDEDVDSNRASRMYDTPSKYLTTGNRTARTQMPDRLDVSDDDGISSGTHTPVSLIVTQCSMSDSDSCLQNDFPAVASTPEDCDDDDRYFIPTSVIANVTLPRHRKMSRNVPKLEESHRSKSQESLLTTIVNAVTKRTGSSTTECSAEASQFASSIASSLVGSCSSFRHVDESAAVSSPISKPSRHNSMDKGVGEVYKSNFITWEGRESVTLPRPRHRKIGNVGMFSFFFMRVVALLSPNDLNDIFCIRGGLCPDNANDK